MSDTAISRAWCVSHGALQAIEEDPNACWEYDGVEDCRFVRCGWEVCDGSGGDECENCRGIGEIPSNELIETVAPEIHRNDNAYSPPYWDDCYDEMKRFYREQARHSLIAARAYEMRLLVPVPEEEK